MRRLFYATAMLIAVNGCDQSEQRVAIHDPASKQTIYGTRESRDQIIVAEGVADDEAALARRSFERQRIITNLEQDLADYFHQHSETHFEERVRLLQAECSLSRIEAVAMMLDMPELLELDEK